MTYAKLRAELVPNGWCWKTSQESLLPTEVRRSTKSSERWPKTGLLRDGHVYELPTLAPPTVGSVGSVLPTPTAHPEKTASKEWGYPTLLDAARLLPTPTGQAAKHGSTPDTTANAYGNNLWDLPHLLPTPASWDGRRGPDLARANRPQSGGMDLTTTLERLLPTPTCQDGANTGGPSQFRRHALPLNTLVTTFPDSGPMPPPSPDGNPLSDDQRLIPPTTSGDSTQPSSSG